MVYLNPIPLFFIFYFFLVKQFGVLGFRDSCVVGWFDAGFAAHYFAHCNVVSEEIPDWSKRFGRVIYEQKVVLIYRISSLDELSTLPNMF